MEEDEDDVFGPVSQCWPSSNREIKQEDHSTQTPGSPVARLNGMLPCGVADEPRRLFYGKPDLHKNEMETGLELMAETNFRNTKLQPVWQELKQLLYSLGKKKSALSH